MVDDFYQLAREIEIHEAEARSICVEATAEVAGNPLRAEVDRSGNTPLCTLAAINFGAFNRVVALGVKTPATENDVDVVEAFYAARSQSRYVVEVTPATQPPSLRESLLRRGLEPSEDRVVKLWRDLEDIPTASEDIEVRLLTVEDRQGFADVNLAAWGMPSFFGAWYGATLGHGGFYHYGVFEGDLLTSTHAMYVSGDLAWTGFGATHPQYQGRGYQTARIIRELQDAASLGCRIIHNETATGTPAAPNKSMHNLMKLGFNRIYEKELFSPEGPGAPSR